MKIKTDLYTKIVLTTIAIALIGLLVKDMDFVTKAQATELDVSAMKIENASDTEETTFYIYENDKILGGFGTKAYKEAGKYHYSSHWGKNKIDQDVFKKAYINEYIDTPKYIITTKTGSFWLER